jgi:hypothetical protein
VVGDEAPLSITIAVEGDLDETLVRRIANLAGLLVGKVHGRGGKSGLLRNLRGYNNAARYAPWVVLLDLDRDHDCAPPGVRQWLPEPASNMHFRIAVRSIEAWLLADREWVATRLGVASSLVPDMPDGLSDPKRSLVNLARRSRYKSVREEVVPREGSGRSVGPLYTSRLQQWVDDPDQGWSPKRAMAVSDSLARAVRRLSELARERH